MSCAPCQVEKGYGKIGNLEVGKSNDIFSQGCTKMITQSETMHEASNLKMCYKRKLMVKVKSAHDESLKFHQE